MSGVGLWRVAWRNLWRNPRRTALTLSAIAFGLFLTVLMTATQDRSFADLIDSAARMGGGHVTVQHPEYQQTPTLTRTVARADEVVRIAQADPNVLRAVPRIRGQGMIATAHASYGAYVVGYDPAAEDASTLGFLDGEVHGELLGPDGGTGVVLGADLARRLGVDIGDKVVYTLLNKEGEIVGALGRVRGTVRTGAGSLDGALVLVPLSRLREQLATGPHEATQVAIFLRDPRKAAPTARRLGPKIRAHGVALTWYEVAPELSGFIAMKVGGARFLEGVLLILVAASIFNTLFVSVLERTREFGVLLAIGYTPGQIRSLVVWESAWLALVGLAAGGAFTLPVYLYLAKHGIDLSAQLEASGQAQVEVAGVAFDPVIPVGIFPDHAAIIAVVIAASTVAAGLYPAWRAGSVEPVDAIKLV